MRIAVISDTHDRLPGHVSAAIADADEIWHLGDVCMPSIIDTLKILGRPLRVVRGARTGEPLLELRFRNGYVTGVVATSDYDRFLSYGVHLERFRARVWYRVPSAAAEELRRLAATLTPLRMTPAVLGRSH